MIPFLLTFYRLYQAIVRVWRDQEVHAAMVLAAILLVTGTYFYTQVEGWSWVDALYFCIATVSTVGYGDLTPQTTLGKLFTVVYILIGVGLFVLLFSRIARSMIEEDIERKEAKRKKKATGK